MEELKILYKELQERQKHLESRKKTNITEARIAENLLTIVRVQQLLIPLVVQQSELLLCKHCDNKKALHSKATGLCPDRFKHFEAK
jgi:hypothetical protein